MLALTVIVKVIFFPLANRSYASMAAMRRVGPEMKVLQEKFKDDLIVLPLPDFGTGVKTGQGSWQWAIGKKTADADAAWTFIEYTLQPEQQKLIAGAAGAIPARSSVANADPKFAAGGDLELFVQQHSKGLSVPRPTTPAYNTVSNAFNQAIQDIIDKADVKASLDAREGAINSLNFSITALMVVSSSQEPVNFDAQLQPSTLHYSISKARRAAPVGA